MTRYIHSFLIILILSVIIIVAGLYLLDPLAIHHPNHEKYYPVQQYLRVVKPYWADYQNYDGLVHGSSRVYRGINPDHVEQYFEDVTSAFIFAVPAAKAYETRRFVQHGIEVARPSRILIEASPFIFRGENQGQFEESRIAVSYNGARNPNWKMNDLMVSLFSADAVNWSADSIAGRGDNRKHRPDGKASFGDQGASKRKFIRSVKKQLKRKVFLDKKNMVDLEYIFSLACKKNVLVDVFFPPIHATFQESLKRNSGDYLDQAKIDFTNLAAESSCPDRIAIWDFMILNKITMESAPLDNYRMRFYADTSHFLPDVGELLIQQISMGVEDADLGIRLLPENIESHLESQKIVRARWLDSETSDAILYNKLYLKKIKSRKHAKESE